MRHMTLFALLVAALGILPAAAQTKAQAPKTQTAQSQTAQTQLGKKDQARCTYIMRNLKPGQAVEAKFRATLASYLHELRAAKDIYDKAKEPLKNRIKADKLTDAEATALMKKHWQSDRQIVQVREKYTPLFTNLVGAKLAYKTFRLANDKMQ